MFELGGTRYVALAGDVTTFEPAAGVATTRHSLDELLGAAAASTSTATRLTVLSTRLQPVTLTSATRPRFAATRKACFYRLPRLLSEKCAPFVRGVHLDAEILSVWLDFRLLADTVEKTGAPA